MVKNEADIIEQFVRYNLNNIDLMFIADNLSQDGTLDILHSLVKEGLPVIVLSDPEAAFMQSKKSTEIYKYLVEEYQFDIVFLLDADEFIDFDRDTYPEDKPSVYIDRLHYLYPAAINELSCDKLSWTDSMSYRATTLQSPKCSITLSNILDNEKIRIAEGNHHIFYDGSLITERDNDFHGVIRHFPIRSCEQFIRKNTLGWIGLMLQDGRSQGSSGSNVIGSHWRDSYNFVKDKDFKITSRELVKHLYHRNEGIKDSCIYEPVLFDFESKFESLVLKDSIAKLLLTSYEASISYLWELKSKNSPGSGYLRDINSYVSKAALVSQNVRFDKAWWHKPHCLVYEIHHNDYRLAFDLESKNSLLSLYVSGRNEFTRKFLLGYIEDPIILNKRIKLFDSEVGQGAIAVEKLLHWLSAVNREIQSLEG